MALHWIKEDDYLYTAPGGYVVEKQAGYWMTYTPYEDTPVYVSPLDQSDYFLEEAQKAAEYA